MLFFKGKEVAESAKQQVAPGNNLEFGKLVKDYQRNPTDARVQADAAGGKLIEVPVERKQGKILDQDVITGK